MTARSGDEASSADPFGAFVSRVSGPRGGTGPLAGLRLAVKDNIAVKGEPFTAGMPLYAERTATETAPAVRRLRDAGATFVGMTRTDSGGFGVTTPGVENPLRPGCSVGGSSGGNAAALAANLTDIALGTDTGGSVRIPAACCGLVGFKPGFGVVPRDSVSPMAPSFDTVGLMARDMATLLPAAAILMGTKIPSAPSQSIRLGVDRDRIAACDPAVAAQFERILVELRQGGVTIEDVTLPDRESVLEAHGIVVLAEARALYAEPWSKSPQLFPETARRALVAAQNVGTAMVADARAQIAEIGKAFARACAGVDAIATPTLPIPPPPCGAHRVRLLGRDMPVISALIAETSLANVTGSPAITLPSGRGAETLIGLHLSAPQGQDLQLLGIAARLASTVGNA